MSNALKVLLESRLTPDGKVRLYRLTHHMQLNAAVPLTHNTTREVLDDQVAVDLAGQMGNMIAEPFFAGLAAHLESKNREFDERFLSFNDVMKIYAETPLFDLHVVEEESTFEIPEDVNARLAEAKKVAAAKAPKVEIIIP